MDRSALPEAGNPAVADVRDRRGARRRSDREGGPGQQHEGQSGGALPGGVTRNHFTVAVIWAVGAGLALAQPIPHGQGTVIAEARDSLTQVPLPGVRVSLQGGEPGVMSFIMVNSTGADGSFPFPDL